LSSSTLGIVDCAPIELLPMVIATMAIAVIRQVHAQPNQIPQLI